jgi:Sec-independent protein translocase protein TatA
MEVLGVGPLELFFILIIALIFLGPRDMVKAGRTLGKYMRMIVMSPAWRMVQQTSRELRTLPNRMIREAGMEEDLKDLNQLGKDVSNQIGSLRKPFSTAAGEASKEIKDAQASLDAADEPAAAEYRRRPR